MANFYAVSDCVRICGHIWDLIFCVSTIYIDVFVTVFPCGKYILTSGLLCFASFGRLGKGQTVVGLVIIIINV